MQETDTSACLTRVKRWESRFGQQAARERGAHA